MLNLSTSSSDVNSKCITAQSNAIKRNNFSTLNKNYFECSEFFTEKKLAARSAAFDQETEAVKNALLGTNREIVQDGCNHSINFRLRKWARQAVYRETIETKAANFCHRGLAPLVLPNGGRVQRNAVDIWKNKQENFGYGGLFTCGSVWACPVCASKIATHRREELSQSIAVAEAKGIHVLLETLTAPHHLGESPNDLLNKMTKAHRLMLNRTPWKRLKLALGLKGTIRALEVLHGWVNGWHVHFHVLLFISEKLSEEEINDYKKIIFDQWKPACLSAGLQAPSELHGVDLVDGRSAGNYVGKWGVEDEMTKSHIKKGHDDLLTPFSFLDKVLDKDKRSDDYKALYKQYAQAFKGRRQLVFSKGLRALLQMPEEISDEEIAESVEPDSELFAQIPLKVWSVILKKDKRGEVLEACRGGVESLNLYLDKLMERGENEETQKKTL